jgi:hypothetical protein
MGSSPIMDVARLSEGTQETAPEHRTISPARGHLAARLRRQVAAGLLETAVACGILAVALASLLTPLVLATHRTSADPRATASRDAAEAALSAAADVLKYEGGTVPDASAATSAPLPAGTPLPLRMELSSARDASGTLVITAIASYRDGPIERSIRVEAAAAAQAPRPGSTVLEAQPVAAPTGAP